MNETIGNYERRLMVNTIDSGLTKQVTVRILWNDVDANQRSIDFDTMVSSYKPNL